MTCVPFLGGGGGGVGGGRLLKVKLGTWLRHQDDSA